MRRSSKIEKFALNQFSRLLWKTKPQKLFAVFTRLNAVSDFVQPERERRITELIEYTGNINKR